MTEPNQTNIYPDPWSSERRKSLKIGGKGRRSFPFGKAYVQEAMLILGMVQDGPLVINGVITPL